MALASASYTYSTLAALALDKLSDKIADAISTANAFLYFYKKRGNWESVSSGGRQLRKSVMYQLQTVRPLGSYGMVNLNPIDSHTSVYYDWVQAAVPVSFSDMEEFQTSGEESIETIVKAKYAQAKASLDDFFSRALLLGQASIDGETITTAVTSPLDGSVFVDPVFKLASLDVTSSFTVGGVDQSTNSWWRNQTKTTTATTLGAFLQDLRSLHVLCQRGGGGADKSPDFHVVDERTYNVYEKALALYHRNQSYQKADIPFDNVLFKGAPVIADELVPDITAANTAYPINASTGDGSWLMWNSAFAGFTYDKKSFKQGPTQRPNNQLLSSSLMAVRGAHWTNNRRKLGVMGSIVLETLEAATS